jgi:hypothetical protein
MGRKTAQPPDCPVVVPASCRFWSFPCIYSPVVRVVRG